MFRSNQIVLSFAVVALLAGAVACSTLTQPSSSLNVLATTTFLAEMAQNVAGNGLHVDSLMPIGTDPHSFEPTPGDVRRIADIRVDFKRRGL